MIDLFLNNKRVFISSDSSLKIVRENPYLSSSGDYTFDVILPLSIIENRMFFGPWHRIDVSKDIKPYSARLYINNKCIINGSAKVTGISGNAVKMQLYGDRSEFNAVHGDKFIDELNLPFFHKSSDNGGFGGGGRNNRTTRTDDGYKNSGDIPTMPEQAWNTYIYPCVYNETADRVINVHTVLWKKDKTSEPIFLNRKENVAQFNFFFVLGCIFKSIGYKLDYVSYEREPFNHIYIAGCVSSSEMVHCLPHWRLKDFLEEVEKFFGCKFKFNSAGLEVKMLSMYQTMFDGSRIKKTKISVYDAFSSECSEDEFESVTSCDLHYDLSNSIHHDIDYLDEMRISNLPIKEYSSLNELLSDYEKMNSKDRGRYLLRCPEGDYCQWIFNSELKPEDKITKLIHINHFCDLSRNKENSNTIDLKICPVAMADAIPVQIYAEFSNDGGSHDHSGNIGPVKDRFCYQTMIAMEGKEDKTPGGHFTGGKQEQTEIILDTTEIQDLLQEDGSTANYEKPDRMEVFFWDETFQNASEFPYSGKTANVNAPAAFTAYDLKNFRNVQHKKWSMSLKKDSPDILTMEKNHSVIKVRQDEKFHFSFAAASTWIGIEKIFMMKNKKYIAESIEYDIKNGEIDRQISGYFYQIE